MPDASHHAYRAFGLSIASDLALPELIADPAPGIPDVSIRQVAVVPPAAGLHDLGGGGFAGPDRFDLTVPGTATLSVRDGRLIEVATESDAVAATVRALLLGSAMGALLFQRGRVPLHASVVALGARAVAFLGQSGAGKSTLALALGARGQAVLGDDLCSPDADARVAPAVTRLKLWPASLAATGHSTDGLERVWSGWDKCILPPAALPDAAPRALAGIVALGWGDAVTLTRLGGAAAIEALMVNSFRGLLVEPMGIARAHMERCVLLARAVPVWRLERPRDLAVLEAAVDAVLTAFA